MSCDSYTFQIDFATKPSQFWQNYCGNRGKVGERVAFVASADQGYAHKVDAPIIFIQHPEFADIAKRAISENNLKLLLSLPQQFIEDAKPDSLWQTAMLQGVLESAPMNGSLLSYQVSTYFGMYAQLVCLCKKIAKTKEGDWLLGTFQQIADGKTLKLGISKMNRFSINSQVFRLN